MYRKSKHKHNKSTVLEVRSIGMGVGGLKGASGNLLFLDLGTGYIGILIL